MASHCSCCARKFSFFSHFSLRQDETRLFFARSVAFLTLVSNTLGLVFTLLRSLDGFSRCSSALAVDPLKSLGRNESALPVKHRGTALVRTQPTSSRTCLSSAIVHFRNRLRSQHLPELRSLHMCFHTVLWENHNQNSFALIQFLLEAASARQEPHGRPFHNIFLHSLALLSVLHLHALFFIEPMTFF